MKEYLVGDLEKDWYILGFLCDLLVHVGNEPWKIKSPRPTPRRRSLSRALVATFFRRASIHEISAGLTAWTCLVSSAFNGWSVHAELEDCKEYMSVPRGDHFIGALLKTALCHGN